MIVKSEGKVFFPGVKIHIWQRGILCIAEELKMEKNKGIYQPEVHGKGWSEEKLIKYVI